MQTNSVTVDAAGGPMRIYEARPDAPRGGLIVVQEAFGVNEHIEDVTRRGADAGYYSVAPDFFHRSGGATVDYGSWEKVIPNFEALAGDDNILADVDAGIAYLRGAGFTDKQIGIVGFCFGGRVTFLTALRRALGAAVGFYGGGIVTARIPMFPPLVDEAASLQTPWLGLFGDEDGSIPVDDVERLREATKAAQVDTEIVRYENAGHAFHNDQRDDAYRADEAKDAWGRTIAFFDAHLG